MLALAAPSLHDRPASHSASVTAAKTPIVRSKSSARRAPSSASSSSSALTASASTSSSSSSSSSTSSSSTIVPPSITRTAPAVSHIRSEPTLAVKRHSSPPKSTQSKQLDSDGVQGRTQVQTPLMRAPPAENEFDIHSYPTPDLLRLLASLLNKIATANDGLATPTSSSAPNSHQSPDSDHPPIWNTLFTASREALSTPTSSLTFHARNIPSITLQAYLLRILRYCPTTNEVFLSLLVYFDRMSKLAQEATGSRFVIDSYNVHRLVIAGVTVASKFFSDVFYTNSRYARVGGLPQAELNQLELQFLLLNDFRLSIPTEEMQQYWAQLMRFSQEQSAVDGAQARTNPPVPEQPTASRPLQSMGAFDAFGGAVVSDNASYAGASAPRNSTPKRSSASARAAPVAPDEQEERDQESSVCSETDTDAETDDEPTIRPAHSCASSDTQSLFSNDASEDGADPGSYEDDDATDDENHSARPSRPPHQKWSGAVASVDPSTDGDRLMASP